MKQFLFMRHGETDWNKARVYQGQNDVPLNATGRAQAQEKARDVDSLKNIDVIYVSPLLRAKETAQIIASAIPSVPIIDMPEFMECQSVETARYVLEAKGVKNMPLFDKIPQDGESVNDLFARVRAGLDIVLSGKHSTPLIVAHGGIAAILSAIYGTEIRQIDNCELVRFGG